jgi:uncharacterized protein (DUF4415 family)
MVRYDSVETLPLAKPLSQAVRAMSDAEVARRAAADPDANELAPEFWDNAQLVEPEGTELISLRLPRRVVGHFKATGKGYQTRISTVLASYVDATKKKVG